MSADPLGQQGIDALQELLAPAWNVASQTMGTPEPANLPASLAGDVGADLVYTVSSRSGPSAQLLVQVMEEVSPARIRDQIAPKLQLMKQLTGDAAVLVIARWLSPRSRQVLDELDYGYLDLTGNVRLRLPRVGIVIKTDGASRSPEPLRATWRQQLRGDKAGVLVRALVDVVPGYSATALAKATGSSLSYVSRVLTALEDQGLVRRSSRSIEEVDWRGLLRARAEHYSLLKTNPPQPFTPQGSLLETLHLLGTADGQAAIGQVAVTGSVAAEALAPLVVGEPQLMLHVADHSDEGLLRLRRRLRLLGGQRGEGQVLLLRTASPATFHGSWYVNENRHVAPSQLVLDCLGGPGRMPAEGEAVLEWMTENETTWRRPQITTWGEGRGQGTP